MTPELSIAVAEKYRSRGFARCLMAAMLVQLRLHRTSQLNQGVEVDKPARLLHQSLGSTKLRTAGGAVTIVRTLSPDREPGHRGERRVDTAVEPGETVQEVPTRDAWRTSLEG